MQKKLLTNFVLLFILLIISNLLTACNAGQESNASSSGSVLMGKAQDHALSAATSPESYSSTEHYAQRTAHTTLNSPINWIRQNSRTTQSLNAITYGNGTFVVVANGGNIYHSPDGINWLPRNGSGGLALNGVTYGVVKGSGTFVAVGDNGSIYRSTDGINWSPKNGSGGPSLRGVIYGIVNGVAAFVAVGDAGSVYYSPDGINWNSTSSGNRNNFTSVAYGVVKGIGKCLVAS